MIRLRIVDKPSDADEAAVLANCWQQANARSLAFLVAIAAHVPDDLLSQWNVCYRDAEFTDAWLPAAARNSPTNLHSHKRREIAALGSAA